MLQILLVLLLGLLMLSVLQQLKLESLGERLDVIINIFGDKKRRKCDGHFGYKLGLIETKPRKTRNMLEITLTNEQKVTVTLAPVTATGRTARVDGVPTFEVISGTSTVVPASDGLSAVITSSDDPGDTEILVKADANLGEGVEEISDIIRVSVSGANAANLGLTAGTPEPK